MNTPTDALPQGVPPPTEADLLAAYTKAMLAHARAAHEMFALNAQLEATVKTIPAFLKPRLPRSSAARRGAWNRQNTGSALIMPSGQWHRCCTCRS